MDNGKPPAHACPKGRARGRFYNDVGVGKPKHIFTMFEFTLFEFSMFQFMMFTVILAVSSGEIFTVTG